MLKINDNFIFGKIILAFSGGVDSVVLLDLLLKSKNKKNIILAHLNHNLRAKESDADELFVKNIAQEKKLKFFTEKLKIKPKNENEARNQRYKFLNKIKEKTKANYIALAHHKSDQIETLLLQLIRGTYAFSFMEEIAPNYKWRPLLKFTKKEIYEYAKQNKLKWREDSSNQKNIYNRNILRNILLPEINKINQSFSENFLEFTKNINNNYTETEKQADQFLTIHFINNTIPRTNFLNLNHTTQTCILKKLNPHCYQEHLKEILTVIKKGVGNKQKHGVFMNKGEIKFKNFNKVNLLILASESPQRKKILKSLGYNFIVIPSLYEEVWNKNKSIEKNVSLFAEQKALSIFNNNPQNTIIACDTIVVHPVNGVYLKPKNKTEAKKMISSYFNSKVQVLSALCVMNSVKKVSILEKTEIEFFKINEQDLELLLNNIFFWKGRSGAMSIELAGSLIKNIQGCFFNILGLPSGSLTKILKKF